MSKPHRGRIARLAWLAVLAATGGLHAGCQSTDPAPVDPGSGTQCAAQAYFESKAWPEVFATCASCHVPGGASGGTRLVFKPTTAAGALAANFSIASSTARTLVENGQSLLLLKPTGQVPHGGGKLIEPGSPQHDVLTEMLGKFSDPSAQAGCSTARSPLDGITLADGPATLRKASLQLLGRLPTLAELAAVTSTDVQSLPGLDAVLLNMMTEEAFYTRLKELWNDLLLTDRHRLESGSILAGSGVPDTLRAMSACDSANWRNYTEGQEMTPVCMQATDALAREPLEIIAHVVRSNRPFTEILTAQYRLFNVYEAQLFGLDLTPFAGHTGDPTYFVETRFPAMHGPLGLPEEYAGVLTTTSFLYRYNSTASNRNRARAHAFYKIFLGRDVMKSSPRLDLSTVDFAKSPWKYDPQCTGCHAGIDPVAGAFQHWTNCYDIAQVQYYSTRYCGPGPWFAESDMFAPGVGAGDANKLSPTELPTALARLGAATARDGGFARAVASHVFATLTGHARLSAPEDPTAPNYAALDAAYEAQSKQIEALAQDFVASRFDFKKLVIAVVRSPAFRIVDADREGREELTAMGGGSMTGPEALHRQIVATLGTPWTVAGGASQAKPSVVDPPDHLLSLHKLRVIGGGIDSYNVRRRALLPSTLNAALNRRMALELSCQVTAYDLALPSAQRVLFPHADRTIVPSGNAAAADQQPILLNLQHLHHRLLGETLALDSSELLASYQLLSDLQKDGAAAMAAGQLSASLTPPCDARSKFATGEPLPAAQQFSTDPSYTVRAWQGLVAYLLMDYRFTFQP